MAGVVVREILARSMLSKSGLAQYAVNCYVGCLHGCIYCYARFMRRFIGHKEPWGRFLDARVNAPEVLAVEVKRRSEGHAILSSVCDGWQPAEERYQLSRKCLAILVDAGYEISILTKSSLVSRDWDILAGYGRAEIGATLTTADESLRAQIEPGASPTRARAEALRSAAEKGVRVYAFLGPFMPYLSDRDEHLDALMALISDLPLTHVWVDKLNPRPGVWLSVMSWLRRLRPDLVPAYRAILYDAEERAAYCTDLSARVRAVASDHGLADKLRLGF
ncbi:MAG: radical SAM protein [Armatimonadota bacterium]